MTFVASARRVWRSIVARGRRRGTVVMLGLALHAVRAVLHGRCCAGRDTFVGYLCLPVARRIHWRLTLS